MSDTRKPFEGGEAPTLTAPQQAALKQAVGQELGHIVPVLTYEFKPTDVDPRKPYGVGNMKRVLNAILNTENNLLQAKDERGRSLGIRHLRDIYPQVQGPYAGGSIQVEYHEQATLGFLGDLLWSAGWFVQHGILGIPLQAARCVLENVGVAFLLEEYYRRWLVSLLDQLSQRGLVPGYVDEETGKCTWDVRTETFGRNLVVRPAKDFPPPA